MRKKRALPRKKFDQPIDWLPIDSRLILPFLSFGHVQGTARLFLQLEIILSVLVVVGTIVLAVLRVIDTGF